MSKLIMKRGCETNENVTFTISQNLCNNLYCWLKYMIASTQITSIEILAFIAVLVFELLSRKFLFLNIKDKRNC